MEAPLLTLATILRRAARACLVAAAGIGAAAIAADPPLFVPLLRTDFPDPFVLQVEGGFLAYATNRDKGSVNVQLAASPDLVSWEIVKDSSGHPRDAMPELPPWAKHGFTWAPEVLKTANGYILYFTAKDRKTNLQCVGAATSADPRGPFTSAATAPLICQADLGGTIDASPFRDADGQLYLYVKNDGNNPNARKPVQLWAQRLAPDGLATTGAPTPVLRADAAWEGGLIEAPTMIRYGDSYLLFFSANDFGWQDTQRLSAYAIGYATCRAPTGPCEAAPENPILHSFMGAPGCLSGPGHQAVFQVGQHYLMAFHAWAATPSCRREDWYRFLYVAPLFFKDGRPHPGVGLRPGGAH
ncbi:MAG TPA: glycoside hydrolase family 43 protein [Allosphingosinicella sp.]|jgi:beta-xylosidase